MRSIIRGRKITDESKKNKNKDLGKYPKENDNEKDEENTPKPMKKKPFTISDTKEHLANIENDLKQLIKDIPNAEDLLDKTDISKSLLKEAEGLITEFKFTEKEKKLRAALTKARDRVDKYEERGIKIQQTKKPKTTVKKPKNPNNKDEWVQFDVKAAKKELDDLAANRPDRNKFFTLTPEEITKHKAETKGVSS